MSLNWNALRACMFDLDGTLVDTLGDFELALAGMLRDLGRIPLTRAQIEPVIGKGTEHLVRTVLGMTTPAGTPAADEAQVQQALANYHAHYARINGQGSAPYAGVSDGLRSLHAAGLPMVCVTNKPHAAAQALLADLQLGPLFCAVYGGDSFARRKPDPMPLNEACKALGLPTDAVIMVGDSSNDAQAARAAGCPVVLMSYGYNHGHDVRTADCDAVYDHFADLQADLLRAWQARRP